MRYAPCSPPGRRGGQRSAAAPLPLGTCSGAAPLTPLPAAPRQRPQLPHPAGGAAPSPPLGAAPRPGPAGPERGGAAESGRGRAGWRGPSHGRTRHARSRRWAASPARGRSVLQLLGLSGPKDPPAGSPCRSLHPVERDAVPAQRGGLRGGIKGAVGRGSLEAAEAASHKLPLHPRVLHLEV